MKKVNIKDLKVGDKLKADGGFTCLKNGEVVQVAKDHDGLFIPCDEGTHTLVGQVDDNGNLVGLEKVE